MAVICGMPMRAHHRVVAEDAAEVVGVRKDILLQGQKHAGGVDQVERGNAVFKGDGLRAQNLLRGHGEKRAGLHGGVVGDDHAQAPADAAQSGDDARAGRAAIFGVHSMRRPEAKFEKLGLSSSSRFSRSLTVSRPFACCASAAFAPPPMPNCVFFGAEAGQQVGQRLPVRSRAGRLRDPALTPDCCRTSDRRPSCLPRELEDYSISLIFDA